MAFGNERQGGGGKDTFVRLSGVFPTTKGNLIGRIELNAFNTVFELMTEAQKIGGTVNIIISKNKNTGKLEMYGVVGQPYNKAERAPAAPAGPFGPAPAQQPTQLPAPAFTAAPAGPFGMVASGPAPTVSGSREIGRDVQFGQVDVPKDDFDSLLESFNK